MSEVEKAPTAAAPAKSATEKATKDESQEGTGAAAKTTTVSEAGAAAAADATKKKSGEGAAKPPKPPAKGVTFRVNDVKPAGKINKLSTVQLLSSVKLIDTGATSSHPRGFVAKRNEPSLERRWKPKQLPNGFIDAIALAFDNHLPLSLRPEHFWTLILQGVAAHMNDKDNAEVLRAKFVKHEGRKVLKVIRDSFVLGKPVNDWAGVVAEFDDQIAANVVPTAAGAMETLFSSTTAIEKTCGAVCVMSAMQKFFDYKLCTRCGFPSITLEGSLTDWKLLRLKAQTLIRSHCLPDLGKRWLPAMLPVLDRFVRQYQSPKDVDVNFWQSMCKRGGTLGSGGYTWLNGWFNVFLPYLKDNVPNAFCAPYSPSEGYAKEKLKVNEYSHFRGGIPDGVRGPDVQDLPSSVVTAPVMWEYLDKKIPLEFKSGFLGVEQREDGAVAPCLGWYIQHKTPPPQKRKHGW